MTAVDPRDEAIERWRRLLGSHRTWVAFAHGSCVVLDAPADDPAAVARGVLTGRAVDEALGEAAPLSSAPAPGEEEGWIVTAGPALRVHVSSGDAEVVTARARAALAADARDLAVVHVETGGAPPLPDDVA